MTETKQDEIQQELFGEFGAPASKQKPRFPSLQKAQKPILISTSIEQLLLVSILLILTGCLVFFFGILRGKSLRVSEPARVGAPAVAVPVLPVRKTTATLPKVAASSMDKKIQQAQAVTLRNSAGLPKEFNHELGKPYTIQLITFKKQDLAEKEVAALHKKGYYAVIIPSGDYYQVCAGQYVSKEDANRNLKIFSGKYRDCFIRRR